MDGKTHLIAGGVSGAAISILTSSGLQDGIVYTLLGGVVALVPDLDVGGKLANTLSVKKKWLTAILAIWGCALLVYTLFNPLGSLKWIGVLVGAAFILIPSLVIKQKTMLSLTGIVIFFAGIHMAITWLIMFGLYIFIASRLPHRSLTHSLLGLGYFSWISYYVQVDFGFSQIMLVCTLSYASHLILDMKWLPKNRRGVKLFQPFFKIEF